jgi:hypothetical protein
VVEDIWVQRDIGEGGMWWGIRGLDKRGKWGGGENM